MIFLIDWRGETITPLNISNVELKNAGMKNIQTDVNLSPDSHLGMLAKIMMVCSLVQVPVGQLDYKNDNAKKLGHKVIHLVSIIPLKSRV